MSNPRSHAHWGKGAAWYKVGYFGGYGAVLAVLYTVPDSALVAFAWISYLALHGSDPGYLPIPQGSGVVGAAAPQADEEERDEDDMAHEAPFDPSSLVTQIASVRARSSPKTAAASVAAPDGPSPPVTMASGGVPTASRAVTERDQLASALEDAYVDYDPVAQGGQHGGAGSAPSSSSTAEAALEAARVGERECRRCRARQHARAHHCKSCDRCVATFDHHCGVLGTCIGERNRCRFWTFLLAQSLALTFAIGILNSGLAYRRTYSDWVTANIVALVTLVVLWVLQLLVFGMLVFHSWLGATNTTRFEPVTGAGRLWYLAGTNPHDCDLPYSRGLTTNLRMFCCGLDGCAAAAGALLRCRRPQGPTDGWKHQQWGFPGTVDRDSPHVMNNLWENRYYSCC